ncbi:MAG: hypothetical protein V3V00_14990 [Saprospiraceae bacterium]
MNRTTQPSHYNSELMNRFNILLIICTFLNVNGIAQNATLSDLELQVIKSYQFDLKESRPILSKIEVIIPEIAFKPSKIIVDLLPVKLEDVTYSIKPLAHLPQSSKYYKGYASASFGAFQNLELEASYRHQAPNYFMYGIEASYINIDDKSITNKNRNNKSGSGFLRYYLKPTFWLQYKAKYRFDQIGVFGFIESNKPIFQNETKSEHYNRNQHNISFFKKIKKIGTAINLDNSISTTRNILIREKEHLLRNHLSIKTSFTRTFSLDINSEYLRQISTLDGSKGSYLWNNRVILTFKRPNIGAKIEGLLSLRKKTRILPEGEFYVKGKAHSLTLFYRNNLVFNTLNTDLDEIFLIDITNYSSSVSEYSSYGFEYEFDVKSAQQLKLTVSKNKNVNEQIWINSANNSQYFSFQLLDYSFYNISMKYRIFILNNLSFSQGISYLYLQDIGISEIPHFQKYNISSSLRFAFRKLEVAASYKIGDKVYFPAYLPDFDITSEYQHDISAELKYQLSKTVKVSIYGIDLLDNRFESFAGYKGFGRRVKIELFTKF